MILDLLRCEPGVRLDTDICIVGGGPAGISIAVSLQNSGLDVCLLEGGGLQEDVESHTLYEGEAVGYPMETDIGRYRGLGGSTSRWSGRCAPLSPIDFEERPWITASGWPIGLDAMAPYYRKAWEVCGIRDFVRPDQEVLAELGAGQLPVDPTKLETFIWRYPSRADRPRQKLGDAYGEQLRKSQNVRVVLHANMVGFETSERGGSVRAVKVKTLTGITGTVQARVFVLGAGGLENARILLQGAAAEPDGFGNGHDLVGRYFMQHLRGDTATITATPAQAIALEDACNFFPARNGTRYEVGFGMPAVMQRKRELLNVSAILTYKGGDERSTFSAGQTVLKDVRDRRLNASTLKALMVLAGDPRGTLDSIKRRFVLGRMPRVASGTIRVNVDLEQMPNPDSRVTLSDSLDALGCRKLRVDWRVSPLESETAHQVTEAVGVELKRLGLGEVRMAESLQESGVPSDIFLGTHHHIGTTRMADDPRHGVVDRNCRVHGMDNLFVTGSSVFPTGGHANPTLTIVALAIRLADHLQGTLSTTPSIRSVSGDQFSDVTPNRGPRSSVIDGVK